MQVFDGKKPDPVEERTGITAEFELNGGSSWRVVDWDAYSGGRILAWFRLQKHAELFRDTLIKEKASAK